jgi:hypothetical protein
MGGGAATLGTAMAIGMLKPADVEAHFIVAACENMVSAEAMRPGDILTASNGKTIEVPMHLCVCLFSTCACVCVFMRVCPCVRISKNETGSFSCLPTLSSACTCRQTSTF